VANKTGPTYDQRDLDLVGQIYEASLDPDLWSEVLVSFAERIDAASAVLSFHNTRERHLSYVQLHARDEKFLRSYREYYVRLNPYLDELHRYSDSVYLSQHIVPERELMRTEFYRDWLHPQDVHYHAGGVIFRDEARIALMDWQRPRSAPAFGDAEVRQITLFEPHLKRALTINQKFWGLLSDSQSAMAVLDALTIGVIFANEDKEVVYVNPKAEEMVRLGDGLILKDGHVFGAEPAQTEHLERLLDGAVRTGAGVGMDAGGSMWVGALFDRPYYVLVSPLRTHRNDLGLTGKRVCAAVFVSSPYHPYAVSVQSLRNMFGLTAAEANIVSELANGLTLEHIADRHELSKHTVRTHLKSIFLKTHTRRQAELAKLVRCSPTSVVAEGLLLGPSLGGPMERRAEPDRREVARVNTSG